MLTVWYLAALQFLIATVSDATVTTKLAPLHTDVIMRAIASQITDVSIVCSTVGSGTD